MRPHDIDLAPILERAKQAYAAVVPDSGSTLDDVTIALGYGSDYSVEIEDRTIRVSPPAAQTLDELFQDPPRTGFWSSRLVDSLMAGCADLHRGEDASRRMADRAVGAGLTGLLVRHHHEAFRKAFAPNVADLGRCYDEAGSSGDAVTSYLKGFGLDPAATSRALVGVSRPVEHLAALTVQHGAPDGLLAKSWMRTATQDRIADVLAWRFDQLVVEAGSGLGAGRAAVENSVGVLNQATALVRQQSKLDHRLIPATESLVDQMHAACQNPCKATIEPLVPAGQEYADLTRGLESDYNGLARQGGRFFGDLAESIRQDREAWVQQLDSRPPSADVPPAMIWLRKELVRSTEQVKNPGALLPRAPHPKLANHGQIAAIQTSMAAKKFDSAGRQSRFGTYFGLQERYVATCGKLLDNYRRVAVVPEQPTASRGSAGSGGHQLDRAFSGVVSPGTGLGRTAGGAASGSDPAAAGRRSPVTRVDGPEQ